MRARAVSIVAASPGGQVSAPLAGRGVTAAGLSLAPAAGNAPAFGAVVVGVTKELVYSTGASNLTSTSTAMCSDWTQNAGTTTSVGAANDAQRFWSDGTASCAGLPLYCVE
ncbi:MAG TPA: hypothetical protein VM513_23995 [Kofleriaceae bacterium]|jgi:hypothetical protein|nr:hypothetical protein [Kofleriaceae bacterium]